MQEPKIKTATFFKLTKHIKKGNLNDQSTNSMLWHDLDTALAYLDALAQAASDEEKVIKYKKCLESLKAMKPPS